MAYNRLWFLGGHLAWTVGGGVVHNPGRYLILTPPGNATPSGFGQPLGTQAATAPYNTSSGTSFDAWDYSTGVVQGGADRHAAAVVRARPCSDRARERRLRGRHRRGRGRRAGLARASKACNQARHHDDEASGPHGAVPAPRGDAARTYPHWARRLAERSFPTHVGKRL